MSAILPELRTRGLQLRRDGECVVVRPRSALTGELREFIRTNRSAILEELAAERAQALDARSGNVGEPLIQCVEPVPFGNPPHLMSPTSRRAILAALCKKVAANRITIDELRWAVELMREGRHAARDAAEHSTKRRPKKRA